MRSVCKYLRRVNKEKEKLFMVVDGSITKVPSTLWYSKSEENQNEM